MKPFITTLFSGLILFQVHAQSDLQINENSFQVDNLEETPFVNFTKQKLEKSQFVFIGEQHGIKEVGVFTNAIYNLGQPYNYKTLCIETDAIAAQKIYDISNSKSPIDEARKVSEKFPLSIPFYNNSDDYTLFKNVIAKKGRIWGIDQTFMVQFRMNFDYLIHTTTSQKLKARLKVLLEEANMAFNGAMSSKDFSKNYIFKYDENTHKALLELSNNAREKEVLEQLWKTKKIYSYNMITKEHYKNNNTRSHLMKRNFRQYYNAALQKEKTPRIIFKLGGYHASKGLTEMNIYDIANLGSELAISNDLESVHYIVMGITGKATTGNPFAPNPIMEFDNTKQFPKEIQEIIPNISKKYYVLDLVSLRDQAYRKTYSEEFKKIIFRYDVVVLVKDAEATSSI